MARVKKSQTIDRLIQAVNTIAENRCSLSEEDVSILEKTLLVLQRLKLKKGATYKAVVKELAEVMELLVKFFSGR